VGEIRQGAVSSDEGDLSGSPEESSGVDGQIILIRGSGLEHIANSRSSYSDIPDNVRSSEEMDVGRSRIFIINTSVKERSDRQDSFLPPLPASLNVQLW
jgi:hypothetical protein